MKLRLFHRWVALVASPLIIISSIGGGILLLRKTGLYERRGGFRDTIQNLHNYEIIADYLGLVAVVLILTVAVTGLWLFVQMAVRKARSRR